ILYPQSGHIMRVEIQCMRVLWRVLKKGAKRTSILISILALFVQLESLSAADTNTFGFSGPEIFPVDPQISLLRAADIDGDGLQDIVVANNSRSKITLLLNQTGKPKRAIAQSARRDLNDLPPDARFRVESVTSEKRISDLVVADLNSDGKPDLAYYGEPKEL